MAKCSSCNSTIVMGGVRDGDLRFCNQRCQQEGALFVVARTIPDEVVQHKLASVHQGPCPKCQRVGAIDVHTSHSVWSALILTSSKSTPRVSCTPCGKKAKLVATAGSFFLGWWGFPWGLILTPVQIVRNLVGLARNPPTFAPSAELERVVRLSLAAELSQRSAGATAATGARAS